MNILIGTLKLFRNGGFSQITYFDRLQTYMMANVLRWMYVALLKKTSKQTNWFYGRVFHVSRSCLSHQIIVFHFRAIFASSRENFPILGFNSKVIHEGSFFKSDDRYRFFLTIKHIFVWASEEKKQLIPS